jgi:hypothetical protein
MVFGYVFFLLLFNVTEIVLWPLLTLELKTLDFISGGPHEELFIKQACGLS